MGHQESKPKYNSKQQEDFFERVDMYVRDDTNKRYGPIQNQQQHSEIYEQSSESLSRNATSSFKQQVINKDAFLDPDKIFPELRCCLRFVGNTTTTQSALQVNGTIVAPALLTLNHPYADPDITNWVIMDLNTLSRLPFEKMRSERRFQIGGSSRNTPRLTEVNIASLVKQFATDVRSETQIKSPTNDLKNTNLSVISSQSRILKDENIQTEIQSEHQNSQSPMQNKFFFLQKNENFTDIDDYLNTIESDVPRQNSSNSSHVFRKELDNKFRNNESIQFIKDSKTASSRSLSQQIQMRLNEPARYTDAPNKQIIKDEPKNQSQRKNQVPQKQQQVNNKERIKQDDVQIQDIRKPAQQILKNVQKNNHYDTDDEYAPTDQKKALSKNQYPGQIVQRPPSQTIQESQRKPSGVQKNLTTKTPTVKFYGSLKQQVQQQKDSKDYQPTIKVIQPSRTKQQTNSFLQSESRYSKTHVQPEQHDLQHSRTKQQTDTFLQSESRYSKTHVQPEQHDQNDHLQPSRAKQQTDSFLQSESRYSKTHVQPEKHDQIDHLQVKTQKEDKYKTFTQQNNNASNQTQTVPEIINLQESRNQYQKTINQRQESLNVLQTKIDQILRESSEKKDPNKKHIYQVFPTHKDIEENTNFNSFYKQRSIEEEDSQNHLQDIKQDVDRLSDKINLTISPSFNSYEKRDKSKSQQKQRDIKQQQTTSKQQNNSTKNNEQTLNFDNLPDYKEPAIIQFSWEQLQNYKKK